MTCFVSMPGLMTFSATLRFTGSDLLGDEDQAEAAFADLLPQNVGPDPRPGLFGDRRVIDRAANRFGWGFEKLGGGVVGFEQAIHFSPQLGVAAARLVEVFGALGRRLMSRGGKNGFNAHGRLLRSYLRPTNAKSALISPHSSSDNSATSHAFA